MTKQRSLRSLKPEPTPMLQAMHNSEVVLDREHYSLIPPEHLQPIMHLLNVGQALCTQSRHVIRSLCEEVAKATQYKARLVVSRGKGKNLREEADSPFHFPVRFGDHKYGTLLISPDRWQPASPALSLTISLLLAQTCGTLLHMMEQTVILQIDSQDLNEQRNIDLTDREKEVLVLICRGYNAEKIADQLFISPKTVKRHKHNIYTKLDVHSEHEALLAAYFANLFFPIEEV